MSIGGIDGIGRGGRGFIPPAGGGGGPPPPGGPNGPGDDGDDRKKVTGSKEKTHSLRTVPEMIRELYDTHCGKGRYVSPMMEGRRLPSVETLQWLGSQEGLSDDDRRMLGELRE